MAEEPDDDRESPESPSSGSDGSEAGTPEADDVDEREGGRDDVDGDADVDGDGDADVDGDAGSADDASDEESSEYTDLDPGVDDGFEVTPVETDEYEVPSIETDEDFETLHADDHESDPSPPRDDEDPPELHEAYGMPKSNVEERGRSWAEDAQDEGGEGDDADAGDVAADAGETDAADAGNVAAEVDDAPTSNGGYAGADDGDPYAAYDDYELGGGAVGEGAPDDQEMPLADHIEEMVKRLGVVVVVMAVVSGIVFPFGEDLINFLWYSYLPGTVDQCPAAAATAEDLGPGDAACPRVYHPLAVILARLKIATLAGFLVALPVFVYETYLFMRPGLYPKERRYYLASVPTSLVLAAAGVAFAHFLVIPAIFTYFVYYSDSATTIAFGLAETFDLMILLMGGFAIVFQIPLFIMLALMMGLVTRQWMADRRLIFWGVYAGLAFLFSPDPTGMAPILVAATMITLHEGTLLLAKWTGR